MEYGSTDFIVFYNSIPIFYNNSRIFKINRLVALNGIRSKKSFAYKGYKRTDSFAYCGCAEESLQKSFQF
jgi:hypothetical protein